MALSSWNRAAESHEWTRRPQLDHRESNEVQEKRRTVSKLVDTTRSSIFSFEQIELCFRTALLWYSSMLAIEESTNFRSILPSLINLQINAEVIDLYSRLVVDVYLTHHCSNGIFWSTASVHLVGIHIIYICGQIQNIQTCLASYHLINSKWSK